MTWHFIGLKKISLFIVGYVLVATLAEILAPILLGCLGWGGGPLLFQLQLIQDVKSSKPPVKCKLVES